MQRQTPYILLFASLLLLQVFIFDKLLINTILAPMVYIGFIILLPLHTSRLVMLALSLLTGVVFDLVMGSAGIASIVTMAMGYYRIHILNATIGKDLVALGGSPTTQKLGWQRFMIYLSTSVLIHNILYFSLEFLNINEIWFLLRRIVVSSSVSILVLWLIAGRFGQLLSRLAKREL